ncbi:MAG: TetR/AcrR family transcriptional regulator [Steroidobacteraceae bacterium]
MPKATSRDADRAARRVEPRQQRAQQTVARIKRAMLAIVTKQGYVAATTNRVADEAHVNIATVYHYFPNQHAIAHAIYEEALLNLAELLNDMLLADLDRPLGASVGRFVERLLEFMKKEELVLLRFSDQIPDLSTSSKATAMSNLGRNAARAYLRHKCLDMSGEQIDCKLYFASTMTMSMIQQYIRDPHPRIKKAQFVDELSRIVTSYLQSPATLPTRRQRSRTGT